MRRFFSLLITLPFSIFCLSFAASNAGPAHVHLSPLGPEFDVPVWLVGLGMAGLGFLCGALLIWMDNIVLRFSRARALSRLRQLEKESGEQVSLPVQLP